MGLFQWFAELVGISDGYDRPFLGKERTGKTTTISFGLPTIEQERITNPIDFDVVRKEDKEKQE